VDQPFYIYNTLSRSIEEFKALRPGVVTYYSCGPTVYLPQHLGNMRCYLFYDTLRRALEFNGYRVRHVMNITDVGHMTSDQDAGEDKIEKTARAEGRTPQEVADFYIGQFKDDLARLNLETPEAFCRATEHVPEMQALIARILERGFAYVTSSGVYFEVEKYRGANRSGRLSRQSLDEQHTAQRLEHSSDKRSPHDFALWVLNQPNHLMQWDSPWGRGYPGWHIECSAMSLAYFRAHVEGFDDTIDIHSGGIDHIAIHHENEIAQSESATGKPFVRYFVHNAFLVGMEGEKISKSAGRFPVLEDLIGADIHPLGFRLFCLGAKYRSQLAFSGDAVRAAAKKLEYFREFARNVPLEIAGSGEPDSAWTSEYQERFRTAVNNDLNTPQALAVALELVAESYRRSDRQIWQTLKSFDQILGLGLQAGAGLDELFPPEIDELISARRQARERRDFKRSDELRAELERRGFIVKDHGDGTSSYAQRG
jgi:cysteinyl-tRNA synthetase